MAAALRSLPTPSTAINASSYETVKSPHLRGGRGSVLVCCDTGRTTDAVTYRLRIARALWAVGLQAEVLHPDEAHLREYVRTHARGYWLLACMLCLLLVESKLLCVRAWWVACRVVAELTVVCLRIQL